MAPIVRDAPILPSGAGEGDRAKRGGGGAGAALPGYAAIAPSTRGRRRARSAPSTGLWPVPLPRSTGEDQRTTAFG